MSKDQRSDLTNTDVQESGALALPDYPQWGIKDLWTSRESIALLMNWDPALSENMPQEHRGRFEALLEKLERDTGKTITHFNYTLEVGDRYFPWLILQWADGAQIPVPQELRSAVMDAWPNRFRTGALRAERDRLKLQIVDLEQQLERSKAAGVPAYLRKDHNFFSLELYAAVIVWTELFEPERVKPRTALKQQIAAQLRQYNSSKSSAEKLSDNAVDRIATLVNPRKKGGAPSSS